MKTYTGTFNYQGEIHTLQTKRINPSVSAAKCTFTWVLAKKLDKAVSHIRAYFNGSKDNYKIEEVKMRDPNEPSIHDHGAPWNEDDEGNCACSKCIRTARSLAQSEEEVEDETG